MEERYGFKDNERLKKRTSLQRAFVLESKIEPLTQEDLLFERN